MPASGLTRRARQSLARLRVRRGRRYGRFRLSPRLRSAERLVRSWIAALDPAFAARLPRLEVVPAEAIVRISGRILLEASRDGRRGLRVAGDCSTQAVSYVRERVLVLHRRLLRQRWLGQRLFYHELCHFLWPRLAAGARRRYLKHLRRELAQAVRGELGYSAQDRKRRRLRRVRSGSAWREYACESFCDTGAYALARAAGLGARLRSVEFTLAPRHRPGRLAAWQRALGRSSAQE